MATSGDLSWPPVDTFSWPRTTCDTKTPLLATWDLSQGFERRPITSASTLKEPVAPRIRPRVGLKPLKLLSFWPQEGFEHSPITSTNKNPDGLPSRSSDPLRNPYRVMMPTWSCLSAGAWARTPSDTTVTTVPRTPRCDGVLRR